MKLHNKEPWKSLVYVLRKNVISRFKANITWRWEGPKSTLKNQVLFEWPVSCLQFLVPTQNNGAENGDQTNQAPDGAVGGNTAQAKKDGEEW